MSAGGEDRRAGSLVLGTAGHIDHGKSTLVKALTGVDPDRLAEEKRRGMTIELGFARLVLPSGRSVGVVDVPGHERFVRQMVAGASGIDMVLLVVAADDGVMPQTREHLAVIDLLGIERGVVAITKADLVDGDWLELVAADVRTLLEPTALAGSRIVPVSARTGAGLPELLGALDEAAATAVGRHLDAPPRLPVDRVFTIPGAGTVVTGTLWSGSVRAGDMLELHPGARSVRVRSVQVHDEAVEEARAGNRVAMNLVGVEVDEIDRGDTLAEPGSLHPTDRFDARIVYLGEEARPLATGARVHVAHGTRDVLGVVMLLDGVAELQAGESALAQVRLEHSMVPRYGDRFILRSNSGTATIGGGEVLDVAPGHRTALRPAERALLEALAAHDISAAASALLEVRGAPMGAAGVAEALGIAEPDAEAALREAGTVVLSAGGGAPLFVEQSRLDDLVAAVVAALKGFHSAEPSATGMTPGALRDALGARLTQRAFEAVLAESVARGVAEADRGEVRDPLSAAAALAAGEAAAGTLGGLLEAQGLAPSGLPALAQEAGLDVPTARRAMTRLTSRGTAVQVSTDLYFSATAVAAARSALESHIRANGPVLAAEVRDLLGTSRKYVMPLLEYFDSQGVTKRDGDVRVLRQP